MKGLGQRLYNALNLMTLTIFCDKRWFQIVNRYANPSEMYAQIHFWFDAALSNISDCRPRASFLWEERFDLNSELGHGADKPNIKAYLKFKLAAICTANLRILGHCVPLSFKKPMMKLLHTSAEQCRQSKM